MDAQERLRELLKIAEQSGVLTNLVKNKLNLGDGESFRSKFLKLKPGPEREKLVLDAVLAQGKPLNLVPVTVSAPDGSKITYNVMPDYVQVDGIRVPLSGVTAQKIADSFGMVLPSIKMSKQIYNAADTKAFVSPLSAGGMINGKYYSGQEVVNHKIGDSDAALQFSQNVDAELNKLPNKNQTLRAGFSKDIIEAPESGKLGLYGLYYKGKPIQDTISTPHDTNVHSEYISHLRLIDNNVIVTKPDGTQYNTTIDNVKKDPHLALAIADKPGEIRKYRY